MSAIQPEQKEYETPDGLKVARDIAWVIKSVWGLAVIFAIAIAWGVTLANDVKNNTEKLKEASTSEQLVSIAATLKRIEDKVDDSDERQRQIKSQLDKLEGKVDAAHDE